MTQDLFQSETAGFQPLAARMRPRTLDEFCGQTHLLAPGRALRQALEQGRVHSLVLWGPPGVGKTTLARLIAQRVEARFETLSAVMAGVKDIRQLAEIARAEQARGSRTLVFVDEVHRFNKSQQDAFLPLVEEGLFIFIGATTENPSFELNSALLSRAPVYRLRPLESDSLVSLLRRALEDSERGLGHRPLEVAEETLETLAQAADGDARRALNLLELAADLTAEKAGREQLDQGVLAEVLGSARLRAFDKSGDIFYDQISAFHKSVRGSSPDGALYWYARMLDGGCDPLYVARRLLAIASEDIGNADPRAMEVALNAWDAFERLGPAEGERAIAQAAVYCAAAPKSNAVYRAFNAVRNDVARDPAHEVPLHLRNAPTRLMKEAGFGAEYRYAHDEPEAYAAGECYLPEALAERRYYQPEPRGLEVRIGEKLRHLESLDRQVPRQRYRSRS